ncbi:hypothetical protein C0Q70_02392 [Pomacea canaliculata]|uniref:Uncharacterized protein n=1 Tax=Pomacea canaliculata TaxID=400727 RepID=A0A2T7PPU9_POMCA|nr:hypothetical protein C0Q70_02392 [Pomacea canaliculata]
MPADLLGSVGQAQPSRVFFEHQKLCSLLLHGIRARYGVPSLPHSCHLFHDACLARRTSAPSFHCLCFGSPAIRPVRQPTTPRCARHTRQTTDVGPVATYPRADTYCTEDGWTTLLGPQSPLDSASNPHYLPIYPHTLAPYTHSALFHLRSSDSSFSGFFPSFARAWRVPRASLAPGVGGW